MTNRDALIHVRLSRAGFREPPSALYRPLFIAHYSLFIEILLLVLLIPRLSAAQTMQDHPANGDSSGVSSNAAWWIAGGAGFGAATWLLMRTDDRTSASMIDLRKESAFVRSASPVVTDMGHPIFLGGMIGGLYLYGLLDDDDRARTAAVLCLESLVASGCITYAIKELAGRERPYAATAPGGVFHGPFTYITYNGKLVFTDNGSFPSGHTTAAFSAATAIGDAYDTAPVRIVSYTLAALVGVSRVIEGEHWFSDCFVGAGVGIAGAKLVEWLNGYSRVSFTFVPVSGGYGAAMSVRF